MQRAVILIVVMALVGTVGGLWMERSLDGICAFYLEETAALRRLVKEGSLLQALEKQARLYARWQGEERKLKAMVSHHHTRAAAEALLALTTSLEEGWRMEALLRLDALEDALVDLRSDMRLGWENVL